jgi:hypothetical protein
VISRIECGSEQSSSHKVPNNVNRAALLVNCFHAVPPKRLSTFNGLHGVISQKIVLFKLIVNCKDEVGLAYSKSQLQDLSRTTAEKHEHSEKSL